MNVKIEYDQEAEDKALESMSCYVTQYTAEELKEDRQKKLADASNAIHFRKFAVGEGLRREF